jgi:pimeloyl-ACP methyl ester carboxylesterase
VPGAHNFADINGNRLRYRLEGTGPLAVFGHGLLGSIEQIDEAIAGVDDLHQHVRLLTYDARGHGHSAGPSDPSAYTWESLGLDMCGLIAHAGETAAITGGASMGAATALWVALERPELVRALVLVMPPPLGHDHMRGDAERQAIKSLDVLAAAIENFGVEQTIALAKQMPGFAATPEEGEQKLAFLRGQNPLALVHAIRGLLQAPFHDPECYRSIKVPTLIVAHEGDGLHPIRAAQLLEQNIGGSKLLVGPDPGYWRRNPGEFIAAARGFLASIV